jgi:hypothetical protein
VPMTMVWSSYAQGAEILHPFLYSVDGYLDLNQYMVGSEDALREGLEGCTADAPPWASLPPSAATFARRRGPMAEGGTRPWAARLRAFIAYNASHWVAFVDTVEDPSRVPPFQQDAPSGWMCFNDSRVFPVAHPMRDAIVYSLQPSVLFWEVLPTGTPIPADWGRDRLHGRVCLACRTVGDVAGPPRMADLPSVASEAEFPSLGGGGAGGGGTPVRSPPPLADVNDPAIRARIPKRKPPPMSAAGAAALAAAAAAAAAAGKEGGASAAAAPPVVAADRDATAARPATQPAVPAASPSVVAPPRPPASGMPSVLPVGHLAPRPAVARPLGPHAAVGSGAPFPAAASGAPIPPPAAMLPAPAMGEWLGTDAVPAGSGGVPAAIAARPPPQASWPGGASLPPPLSLFPMGAPQPAARPMAAWPAAPGPIGAMPAYAGPAPLMPAAAPLPPFGAVGGPGAPVQPAPGPAPAPVPWVMQTNGPRAIAGSVRAPPRPGVPRS